VISRLGTPRSQLSNVGFGVPSEHIVLPVIGTVIRIAARYSTTLLTNRR
jgi:hypothetical protein